MSRALIKAQISRKHQIQQQAGRSMAKIWRGLPDYNEGSIPAWLAAAEPIVLAARQTTATMTDVYVARMMGRAPLGVDSLAIAQALRNGTPIEEVYRRPFTRVWRGLSGGEPWEQAVLAGLVLAQELIATDSQLAFRDAAMRIEEQDENMFGYTRVANPDACEFCQAVDGAYVKGDGDFAMLLHKGCNCGLEPNTEPHPRAVNLPGGQQARDFQYGPLNELGMTAGEGHELGAVFATA